MDNLDFRERWWRKAPGVPIVERNVGFPMFAAKIIRAAPNRDDDRRILRWKALFPAAELRRQSVPGRDAQHGSGQLQHTCPCDLARCAVGSTKATWGTPANESTRDPQHWKIISDHHQHRGGAVPCCAARRPGGVPVAIFESSRKTTTHPVFSSDRRTPIHDAQRQASDAKKPARRTSRFFSVIHEGQDDR